MHTRQDTPLTPAEWQHEATCIFERITKTPLAHVQQCTGGNINRVFVCTSSNNNRMVLRLAPWSQAINRRGAAAWAGILAQSGTGVVPYTSTASDDDPSRCFWMAMPFVEGSDLAKVLPEMTASQQRNLAETLFARQNLAVDALNTYAHGDCGRALRPDARRPQHQSLLWGKYLIHEFTWRLRRVRQEECGSHIYGLLEKVLQQLNTRSALDVPNVGFMYDIGDRNVMVKHGKLSGIIDQDCVFFGDRLLAPAVAWAALQASSATRDSVFVEHWCQLEWNAAGSNGEARWASVRLFCAGWIASQTGSVAQNGEVCSWEPNMVVELLEAASNVVLDDAYHRKVIL